MRHDEIQNCDGRPQLLDRGKGVGSVGSLPDHLDPFLSKAPGERFPKPGVVVGDDACDRGRGRLIWPGGHT
jgi:hypothetical protein